VKTARLMSASERWFRLLLRFYPPDFRDEMGVALVEAYRDRARQALLGRGALGLAAVWLRALADSIRNGPGERAQPSSSWRRAGNWGRDAELATRRLLRAPAFVAATLGTLTIGLGMFAVVFTIVQKVLVAPMPYPEPDDLYFVWRDYGPIADLKRGAVAGSDVAELQKAGGVIQGAVALQPFLGGIFALREGSDPMEIAVTWTSPGLFELLGVKPALGRTFEPHEAGPGRANLLVLTHDFWSRLGADPGIVGSLVRLQGNPYTVIGVMPKQFRFVRQDALGPAQRVDAYTTFPIDLKDVTRAGYSGLIRARHGSSQQALAAAVDGVGRGVDERDFNKRGLRLYPVGLKADLVSRIRPALVALGAAGALLALMLLVNLASVLLARAAQREHEHAVSRALGADGVAVARATLLEGSLLGLAGGALGALLASWATRALIALAPLELPRREAVVLDWGIAFVVVGVGALLGLLAAAAPAVWTARASLAALLASSAVRGGGGHGRLRRGMIVAQVALSLVLLCSGGLVVRSLERLLRADPGFRPEGLLSVRIRTPPEFFPTLPEMLAFQDRLVAALAALPGATGASAATALPLSAGATPVQFLVPGAPGNTGDPAKDALLVDMIAAKAQYVEVMGMRLLEGRSFEAARREGVREALIDSAVARRFFPGTSALGARIKAGDGPELTVIGVVQQARLYDVHQDGRPQLILRQEDLGVRPLFYVVRTTRDPHALLPELRAAVRRIDARVAVGDARSLDEIVENALRAQRTSAALITAFGVGALLLAAMGLFGVVAGSVTRRRHELAVRLALGADHRRVLRMVLGEGALLVGLGALFGVPGIYAVGGLIRGVLVGVSPSDPLTLAAVAGLLAAVTLLTCYVPARRVLKIDPAQLLRQE
jgi:putative ABC transport system permease protein